MKVYLLILFISLTFCISFFLYGVQAPWEQFDISEEFSGPRNTYCSASDDLACTIYPKKKRAIWLIFDGYQSMYTGDLATFHNNSAYFHIDNKGYLQSAAIFATMLTGQKSRNYIGRFLNEETVIDQFTGDKLIISNDFPMYKLLGKSRFEDEYIYEGREKYPFLRLERCFNQIGVSAFIIKEEDNFVNTQEMAVKHVTDLSTNAFNEIMMRDFEYLIRRATYDGRQNLIYVSSIMDSYNHNYGVFSNTTISVAAGLLANIKALVTVLDSTPSLEDYVLFVTSDHGGQFYKGEDEKCNHGCKLDGGNEAFLYIYSKGIDHVEEWIAQEDIAPTISHFLYGAGIPIKATGIPRPMKQTDIHKLLAYRAKEIQIGEHLKFFGEEFNLKPINYEDKDEVEKALSEYEDYLRQLNNRLGSYLQNNVSWFALVVLLGSAMYLTKPYFVFNADFLMLFLEIGCVICLAPFHNRVEHIIFWPTLISNLVILSKSLYSIFHTFQKHKKGSEVGIVKLIYKTVRLNKENMPLVAFIGFFNIAMLTIPFDELDKEDNPDKYFVYFMMLEILILIDLKISKFYTKLSKILILLYSQPLIALILHYEYIRDTTQTDQTEEMIIAIRIFYLYLLIGGLLIMVITREPRVFVYTAVIGYFFLANKSQRQHLVFWYIPCVSSRQVGILSRQGNLWMLLLQSSTSHLINKGSFGLDVSMRAGNRSWGVRPDDHPIFSGTVFILHKMGWYITSGPFIIRNTQNIEWKLHIMICRAFIAVWGYFMVFFVLPDHTLSLFVWSMNIALGMLFSHVPLLIARNRLY